MFYHLQKFIAKNKLKEKHYQTSSKNARIFSTMLNQKTHWWEICQNAAFYIIRPSMNAGIDYFGLTMVTVKKSQLKGTELLLEKDFQWKYIEIFSFYEQNCIITE